MSINQPVTGTTQVGVVNGSVEGYAKLADLFGAGSAGLLPATDPTNGGAATDTQTVLDNLKAAMDALAAADADKIADAFSSGDNSIVNSGTADAPILSIVPLTVAQLIAGNTQAMQVLAQALLSQDPNNSLVLGSDSLLYENDAV